MADAFWLDDAQVFHSRLLDQENWLAHGFGTRDAALPPHGWKLATVKQIHSAMVLDVNAPFAPGVEADALVTQTWGVAVAVKTADCLPILLADPVKRVVAAVHAGWRGTVQEIVGAAIARMTEKYKTNPSDLLAAIGPGIGKCCFEVGPEVARQFAKWNPRLADTASKEVLDLTAITVDQLTAAGVAASKIAEAGMCTMDRTDLFYSFRKEREAAGRLLSWIGIRDGK
jgi:YfiH family protein